MVADNVKDCDWRAAIGGEDVGLGGSGRIERRMRKRKEDTFGRADEPIGWKGGWRKE